MPTSAADAGAFMIDSVTGDVTTGLVFNASSRHVSFQYRIIASDVGRRNSTVGAFVKVSSSLVLVSCYLPSDLADYALLTVGLFVCLLVCSLVNSKSSGRI